MECLLNVQRTVKFELLQQTFQQYKVGVAGLQEVRIIGECVQRSEHFTMVFSGHKTIHFYMELLLSLTL